MKHSTLDTPCNYWDWPHPPDTIKIKGKDESTDYTVMIYTDGSKNDTGVGSGVAVFMANKLRNFGTN